MLGAYILKQFLAHSFIRVGMFKKDRACLIVIFENAPPPGIEPGTYRLTTRRAINYATRDGEATDHSAIHTRAVDSHRTVWQSGSVYQ